jgi:hypothetical protein
MREIIGKYGRPLLLVILFVGLSFGVFFSAVSSANATPEMSPDGKTCTPCHTDGRTGTGTAGGGEAQKPAEQAPAAQPEPAEQTPAPAHKEPASPFLVIGIVAVVLAGIYVVAIRKKH